MKICLLEVVSLPKKNKFTTKKSTKKNIGGSGDGVFYENSSKTWGFRAVRDGKDTRKRGYATKTEAKEARVAFLAEN